MKNEQKKETEWTFEQAFSRLEEILEKMNSAEVSLDESLKLYEEADQWILRCGKKLNEAEKKIQILIKNRNGELATTSDGAPQLENFRP